jgi:adenylate cyclase, class 2
MDGHETEAKFYVKKLRKIELRLQHMEAQLIQPRTHEANLRFDNINNDLRKTYRVLRLRQDEKAHLTFKGPSVEKEGGILSRREIEFVVEDYESAKHFLEALGFEAVVFYEKFRTTYELNNIHIMLDELPYGEFVEIEGQNVDTIHKTASLLGLNWDVMVKAGYHALFERAAEKYKLDPSQLSFAALKKIKISPADLGIQTAA